MKKIPIAIPPLGQEEAQAAYDTILSGWVTQGPKVKEFEKNFADYVGSKYAVAVSSCTTALHLALIVAGIKEGDEVICPSMSFIATANSIMYMNAVPVFAEVNEEYNLDIEDVESKITSKTRAVILVHQIGMPADIDSFKKLCNEKNLILIEDAACAIGSAYNHKKIGSHSDLVCFSFHPRKVITTGDGGMISTSNKQYYDRLKLLRQHGMSVNDRLRHESEKVIFEEYSEVGFNYRMTDIQAAIGVLQLKKLNLIVSNRREIAQTYNERLSIIENVRLPIEREGKFSNYQSYSIFLKQDCKISRDELMQRLLDDGIASRRGIMNIHEEMAYSDMRKYYLPKSEELSDRSILIPLFYPMDQNMIEYVIDRLIRHLT
ncbi:MAG: DegT/DnrJ/EryC1/StrS family aminotransferase [Reichenbachiella sp.]|uniref:DegT/DnrJ/EryC1/StrS family aminotransferase n=1 Tax=Reichenbachiella sp. TaxID=2184521 RepID=UPI0032659895